MYTLFDITPNDYDTDLLELLTEMEGSVTPADNSDEAATYTGEAAAVTETAPQSDRPPYSVGQQVVAKNKQQVTGKYNTQTRKVMEIAQVLPNHRHYLTGEMVTGYKLRRVGSTSKGGQVVWLAEDLEAAN